MVEQPRHEMFVYSDRHNVSPRLVYTWVVIKQSMVYKHYVLCSHILIPLYQLLQGAELVRISITMTPRIAWKFVCLSALFANILCAVGQNPNKDDGPKRIPITIPTPKGGAEWISPEYSWFFEYPLPLHTIKSPKE